jgi:hypothetical protein
MLRGLPTSVIAVLMALPAYGQVFSVPAQCQSVLTVQFRGCEVSHLYRCNGDAERLQEMSYTADGRSSRVLYNSEGQMLQYEDFENGMAVARVEDGVDPDQISVLLETGEDTYDFENLLDNGVTFRMVGFDRLMGQQIEIDGRALEMTEFAYQMIGPDGEVLSDTSGQQFVDPELRIFYQGIFLNARDNTTHNNMPQEFIGPDEAGFLSARPKYDCEANT